MASIHGLGKEQRFKAKFKKEQSVSEISLANSLRTLFFKPFGPEAFPLAKDFRIDLTLSGVNTNHMRRDAIVHDVTSGSTAFWSLRTVCFQNKSLRRLPFLVLRCTI